MNSIKPEPRADIAGPAQTWPAWWLAPQAASTSAHWLTPVPGCNRSLGRQAV